MPTLTIANAFTYRPTVTTVSPGTVPTEGNVQVTLVGAGFTGATGVTFGGGAATNVAVVNDTTVTCTVPAHVAGSVDVIVVVAGIDGTLVNAITYEVYAGNVAVSGTATPNSTVQVELDNVLVSTVAANGSGAWSTVVSCEAGQHTIRARQVAEPQTFPYSNVVNVTGIYPL